MALVIPPPGQTKRRQTKRKATSYLRGFTCNFSQRNKSATCKAVASDVYESQKGFEKPPIESAPCFVDVSQGESKRKPRKH